MKSFTHLRVASGYSFKYGTAHADQLVERAAEFEMSALALTDMNTMAGAIRFAKSCETNGITPVFDFPLQYVFQQLIQAAQAQGIDCTHHMYATELSRV
jgi:error-prone DNA polymerase